MNKNLVILGAGESGVGAARLAKKQNYNVFVSDFGAIDSAYKQTLENEGIEFEENAHSMDKIFQADLIIKSPGVSEHTKVMEAIREKNLEVISEIEFASWFTKGKIIAITGSNGKTTTTHLISQILRNADMDVAMVGNVGESFAGSLSIQDHDVFVVEVSSFQLDDIKHFKPYISVLTNLSPDHLDRYDYEYKNYIKSKFKITENQDDTDYFVYNSDDEDTRDYMSHTQPKAKLYSFSTEHQVAQGAYIENETILFNTTENQFTMSIYDLALQGKHNAANSMAAGIVSQLMGIRKEVIRQSLQDFQSLEHRMEFVSKVKGIQFINDSKATNVNSTWFALESMTKPVVWIAGGVDKGNDYESLKPIVKEKVHALVCLGVDNKKLIKNFKSIVPKIEETKSMSDAVRMAYYLAEKDDIVLLSPACASFDLFQNFEDRGNQFKQAVREL